MPRLGVAPWLRRGVEAAVAAAILAVGLMFGGGLATASTIYPVPAGLTGALLLAPPVLALAVIAVAYPVAMAATRSDALMGAAAAFLIAADATILIAGTPLALERLNRELPGGVLVALLALIPALVGLVVGQVATPLGFGRRAGAISAIAAGFAAVAVLLVGAVVAI